MKFFSATITMMMVASVSSFASAQQPTDYRTAYNETQQGTKPLLVLVTAEWCPPCQLMKKTTFPQLIEKKAFQNCNFSKVDLDKEEALGRQLMGTQGIPQLIMFEKHENTWVKRSLVGIQTPETIEAFIAQAGQVRLAEAEETVNK